MRCLVDLTLTIFLWFLYAFAKVGNRAAYVCIEKSTRALQSPYFIVSAQK